MPIDSRISARLCHSQQNRGEVSSLGAGASYGLTETAWKIRTLQAWLHGLLEGTTTLGHGHGRMTKIVFHTYNITEAGREFLDSEPLPSLALPSVRVTMNIHHPSESETSGKSSACVKSTRKSKGTHLQPVLKSLLSSSEN